ncbi:hypothetical protein GGX14DRAFT_623084 [Mycena pura]|uniref:Fe2OG dioxygenase domain-containing protein n=1 Tax=Mycena pura TaxID=153505 RepID=A0AAD6YCG3_9AGAR|nr:hypothetical protein GGX14DRAFT_623084 [Mycena pura]
MSPIPPLLRTAIDLKEALDYAAVYLTPIGTCRSKATEWRQNWEEDEEPHEDDGEVEIQAMEELHKLQTNYMTTVAKGKLWMSELPFRLTITRAGCEYDGGIRAFKAEGSADTGERLQRWYEAAAVSGYGDVKAQETKVDPAVRDAREIPASEFSVSPDLIAQVQELWGASFFPTQVRAEAYKIHLYGPGGKFKAHRDTPETDLVGTFLFGLGDTSKTAQGGDVFEIKDKGKWTRHTADLGSWIAFYPDVDHSVQELARGYRAVIAFKIFRQHTDIPEVPADVKLRGKIKDVLMKLQKPYGMLLRHRYSAGTSELNGVDAALYAAAEESGGDVKLLPVLIRWSAYREEAEEPDRYSYRQPRPSESSCSADVFPMTEKHVDTVLAHIRTQRTHKEDDSSDSSDSELIVDLKGTDAAWINNQGTESIPFYSPAFGGTSIAWSEEVVDAVEHTGNESRPHREDSIYLSYAVVVLPKRGTKRASPEEGDDA